MRSWFISSMLAELEHQEIVPKEMMDDYPEKELKSRKVAERTAYLRNFCH